MYEEITNEDGLTTIKYTTEDGEIWWIPVNESNRMYQEYLNWKTNGEA
jgi:hypothetical protein